MPVLVAFLRWWIAKALLLRPPPLLGQPAAPRRRRRLGSRAFALDLEAGGDRVREPFESQLAVPPLAPLFLSDRADYGARLGCEPPLLGVGENRGALHREDGLDAGLRL